jgi:hypothetical protein
MYNKIFKLLGYGLRKDEKYDIPLKIKCKNNKLEPLQVSKKDKIKNICKSIYIYNFFILAVISWKIPYLIRKSVIDKDTNLAGLTSFPTLVSIQYILGIKYFNDKHFYSRLYDHDVESKLSKYTFIFSILGLILTASSIILLTNGYKIIGYSELYKNSTNTYKILLTLLLFIDMFYSYQIMVMNCCTFVINLLSHKMDLTELIKKIEENITDSVSNGIKIRTIAQNYGNEKEKFSNTIDTTQNIFATLNILGFTHITFLIAVFNLHKYYVLHIINAVLFIIIDIIFINVLHTVKSSIGKINGIISGSPFMVTYFNNNENTNNNITSNDIIETGDVQVTNTMSLQNINKMCELNSIKLLTLDQNIDWFNLQYITNQEWDKYVVFGIEISDTKVLGRIIGLVLLLIFGKEAVSFNPY